MTAVHLVLKDLCKMKPALMTPHLLLQHGAELQERANGYNEVNHGNDKNSFVPKSKMGYAFQINVNKVVAFALLVHIAVIKSG